MKRLFFAIAALIIGIGLWVYFELRRPYYLRATWPIMKLKG